MTAHIPTAPGECQRSILEHALEFCDVMDPYSLQLCHGHLATEAKELIELLAQLKRYDDIDSFEFNADYWLHVMALDLLDEGFDSDLDYWRRA